MIDRRRLNLFEKHVWFCTDLAVTAIIRLDNGFWYRQIEHHRIPANVVAFLHCVLSSTTAVLRVDLVCGIPCTYESQIIVYSFVQGQSKKNNVHQLGFKNSAKRFENAILSACLLRVLRRILLWQLTAIGWEVYLYLFFNMYCVLYRVARNGTIAPRAAQFVYHTCILRLLDVLRAETKFATLSSCQNWYLVLCNYQTNL